MTGRMKILRGVQAPSTALPQIRMSAVDVAIASMRNAEGRSAILYDVDPAVLEPISGYSLAGKDRASGKAIQGTRACLTKISSDSSFNGAPVINIDATGGSSDLTVFGPPPASFTMVSVASLAPDLKAAPATARLMALIEPSNNATLAYIALISSGAVAATGVTSIPVADVPAANIGAIYVHTHDASTRQNRIYLNSSVVRATTTSGAPIAMTQNTRLGIGGPSGTSAASGWRGKIARSIMFEGVLPADQITVLVAALKTAYGVI
jgi:hypothetical protein